MAYDEHRFVHTTAPEGALDTLADDDQVDFELVSYDQRAYSKVVEIGPESLGGDDVCDLDAIC